MRSSCTEAVSAGRAGQSIAACEAGKITGADTTVGAPVEVRNHTGILWYVAAAVTSRKERQVAWSDPTVMVEVEDAPSAYVCDFVAVLARVRTRIAAHDA